MQAIRFKVAYIKCSITTRGVYSAKPNKNTLKIPCQLVSLTPRQLMVWGSETDQNNYTVSIGYNGARNIQQYQFFSKRILFRLGLPKHKK